MTIQMLPWVISRATGLAAFALVSAAIVAGLLVRTRSPVAGLRGAALVDVHRHLSLLALLAMGVHGGALLFDRAIHPGVLQLVVPGMLSYRPVATGIGVAAGELALLIHISFRLRGRIGVTTWRRMQFLTYAVFAGGLAHAILSGTDAAALPVRMLYAGATAAALALTGWRAVTARRPARRAGARQTETVTRTAAGPGRASA